MNSQDRLEKNLRKDLRRNGKCLDRNLLIATGTKQSSTGARNSVRAGGSHEVHPADKKPERIPVSNY
jgi:hypothetical protein